MKREAVVAIAVVLVLATVMFARPGNEAPCGPGFVRRDARCLAASGCPAPLVTTAHGCDAPPETVLVPETTLTIGPSDWEAEGRVPPRTVHVAAFRLDRFEATRGRFGLEGDAARAMSGVSLGGARAFCRARGGRLPTEDEWLAAAAGSPPRRYPWGDTGAVCRRAAFGLANGPCARGADGPDTVGAHAEGASPLGIHDLAGNVAEWVETPGGAPAVRGGSWRTELATNLRTWLRASAPPAGDATIGFRCAYGGVESSPP